MLRKAEVKVLSSYDSVKVLNNKDKNLLLKYNFPSSLLKVIPPYYTKYPPKTNYLPSNSIIFYGAMSREENENACLWFIKNVLLKLNSKRICYKFLIIGNGARKVFDKYKNSGVEVTGFVPSLSPYAEEALCMVAPLLQGAGIKIKVLESMSLALPVLTNSIGIEGIDAKDKESYLHCEAPADYIAAITKLHDDPAFAKSIGQAGRSFLDSTFNYSVASYLS